MGALEASDLALEGGHALVSSEGMDGQPSYVFVEAHCYFVITGK